MLREENEPRYLAYSTKHSSEMITQIVMNKQLGQKILEKYDPYNIHGAYDMWPQLASYSYKNTTQAPIEFEKIDQIVFAGMGGSGTSGEIINGILSKTNIHTTVVKGYNLPKTVDETTLVFATSVSGNSDEPLHILHEAVQTKAKIIAISSGGKMQEFCKKHRIIHNKIDMINSPRASLPLTLYSTLALFGENFGIKSYDVKESILLLQQTAKCIDSNNISKENISLLLGDWINQIPVIYYPAGLYASALRFKNSLQENAKRNAMTEDVIEACHNNIVTWEKNSTVQPILIRGADDHFKTKERWNILKQYFEDNQISYKELESVKSSILSKLINLIYVLDYASIYNAILNKIDPTPVASIDYVKSKLS